VTTEDLHMQIQELYDDLKGHALKGHAEITDDPKCAALCETSAEVMGGLDKAFTHYLSKSEKAWL
jgi:hypothetical protein